MPLPPHRYRFRVRYAGAKDGLGLPWFDKNSTVQLDRFNAFGEGEIQRNDESLKTTGCCGEWKVAVNPWKGIDKSKGASAYQFTSEPLQCGPKMCSLPGDNSKCMTNGEWDDKKCPPMLWSDVKTWETLKNTDLNTIDAVHTGRKPANGDTIEIPQNTYVIYDEDAPPLNKFVVVGRLAFKNDGWSITNNTSPHLVQHGAENRGVALVLHPSTHVPGAGCKTRLHTPKAVTYHEQSHHCRFMIGHSLGRMESRICNNTNATPRFMCAYSGAARKLEADRILVWGFFDVGSAKAPYVVLSDVHWDLLFLSLKQHAAHVVTWKTCGVDLMSSVCPRDGPDTSSASRVLYTHGLAAVR